jgi:hypothetical protein
VKRQGYLTRAGLTEYFTQRYFQQLRDREGQLDKILRTGVLANNRKVKLGTAAQVRKHQNKRTNKKQQDDVYFELIVVFLA